MVKAECDDGQAGGECDKRDCHTVVEAWDCHEIFTSEIVTRLSQNCHKRDCHAVVEAWDCHKIVTSEIVTRLSQDCHKRDCHAVVEAWDCHKIVISEIVTRLSQARLSRRSRGLRGHRWSPHYTSGVEERVSNRRQSGGSLPNGGADLHKRRKKSRKKGHFLHVKKSWQYLPDTSLYCIDKKENTAAHLSRGAFLKLAAYSLQSPVEHFGSNKIFNI